LPRQSGLWMRAARSDRRDDRIEGSMSPCGTMYGPAVRRKWIRRAGGERSCINVSGLTLERFVLRAIMDISAPAISLPDRLQRAIRATSIRRRREDRPPSRLILSQTSVGKLFRSDYVIAGSSFCVVSVVRHGIKIRQTGSLPDQSSAPRRLDHEPERSRQCGRACWRGRSPARCDAAVSWLPRSRA